MSELQSESEVLEQPEVEETEQLAEPEQAAELAPDSQGQDEQKAEEHNVNQEAINKVIGKKHFEAQEAIRRAEEAERRLQELEAQKTAAPPIPKKPDPWGDDYDKELDEYEKALSKRAEYDAEQRYMSAQQQQLQQQQQAEQAQRWQQLGDSYTKKADSLGITVGERQVIGQTVTAYGVDNALIERIMSDDDGPLIAKYLAANPAQIEVLKSVDPYDVGLHIESEIRPKAQALRPKSTTAPPPAKKVDGGGADADLGKYQHIKGATFE